MALTEVEELELLELEAEELATQPVLQPVPFATDLDEVGLSKELGEASMRAFKASFGILSASSDDEKASILREQFPEIEVVEDAAGDLIARTPSGDFAINRPGLSPQDFGSALFRFLAFLPASKAKGGVLAAGAKIGAKSAAVETGLQAAESAVGGEFDPVEPVLAGGLGAAGELVTNPRQTAEAITSAVRGRELTSVLGTSEQQAARSTLAAQETLSQPGISTELNRAQQTLDPFLVEETAFVGQLPEGSRPAIKFLTKQNKQVSDDVRTYLNSVAPPEAVVIGPRRVRDAAEKAIELKVAARARKASPIYKQAFEEFRQAGTEIDVAPVLSAIDDKLTRFPRAHPAHKSLTSFRKQIEENADDLEKLQGVKEVIDTRIANLSTQPRPTSAMKKANREVSGIQDLLLEQMDIASPTFKEARATFARESIPVDSLRNSIVGKIANLDETQIKRVAQSIFDPAETNPEIVKAARTAITKADPEAWDLLIRAEITRRMGKVNVLGEDLSLIGGETLQNVPGQLKRAIFGNKQSRDVLFAALDTEQRQSARFLEDALTRASLARPGGSQTGVRNEIRSRLDRGFMAAVRRFITAPVDTAADVGGDLARANRIRAIAEVAYNPDWVKEINRIRRLAGNQERKWLEILGKIEASIPAPQAIAGAQVIRSGDGDEDEQ